MQVQTAVQTLDVTIPPQVGRPPAWKSKAEVVAIVPGTTIVYLGRTPSAVDTWTHEQWVQVVGYGVEAAHARLEFTVGEWRIDNISAMSAVSIRATALTQQLALSFIDGLCPVRLGRTLVQIRATDVG